MSDAVRVGGLNQPDPLERRIVAPVGLHRQLRAAREPTRITVKTGAGGELRLTRAVPVHRPDLHIARAVAGPVAVESDRLSIRRPVREDRVMVLAARGELRNAAPSRACAEDLERVCRRDVAGEADPAVRAAERRARGSREHRRERDHERKREQEPCSHLASLRIDPSPGRTRVPQNPRS